MTITIDAVVIGGGVMGASILYNSSIQGSKVSPTARTLHSRRRLDRQVVRRDQDALLHRGQRASRMGEPARVPQLARHDRRRRRPSVRPYRIHGDRSRTRGGRIQTQHRNAAGHRDRHQNRGAGQRRGSWPLRFISARTNSSHGRSSQATATRRAPRSHT